VVVPRRDFDPALGELSHHGIDLGVEQRLEPFRFGFSSVEIGLGQFNPCFSALQVGARYAFLGPRLVECPAESTASDCPAPTCRSPSMTSIGVGAPKLITRLTMSLAAADADKGAAIWGGLGPQAQSVGVLAPRPPAGRLVDTEYRQPIYNTTRLQLERRHLRQDQERGRQCEYCGP
jgi:hypothetical protein